MKKILLIGLLCVLCACLAVRQVSVAYSEDKTTPESDLQKRVKELIQNLGNDDWQTRKEAQKKLEEIGSPAVPYVRNLLKDEDAGVRGWSAIALIELGVEAGEKK